MNKKMLILVGVVICMLVNVLLPTTVNALEDVLVEENPVVEEVETEIPDESNELDEEDESKEEKLVLTKGESTKEEQEEPVVVKSEEPLSDDEKQPVAEPSGEQADLEDDEAEIEYGEVYDIQKVKVIITKVDEEGNQLAGAKLQVLDSTGKVLDEWVSNGKEHTILLTDGTYTLHEVEAPEGYDLAEDKEFTVKVEIADLDAGVEFSTSPCQHYGGTPLYYVEIEGKKHEVYCINQDWETPDDNSQYDGEILNSTDIRNYTKQTVYVDAHQNTAKIDVSDQDLSSQELYDKILDIIYHRNLAIDEFSDLTEAEIRYVAESALKNYTNAGLTRVQKQAVDKVPENYDAYDYYVTDDGLSIWYLYPWYRSFIYTPDVALGQDIFKESPGNENADAFGTLARHWSSSHKAKSNAAVREQVARYYELYLYLISNDNPHPSDMHLYIYSTTNTSTDLSGFDFDEGAYQNLLGVTGYFEDIKQQELEVEMVDKYSTETVEVTIKKVWNDNNNQDGKRPASLTIALSNGDKVTLNEANGWTATIKDLPKYNKGKLITYTWEEITLPSGYTLTSNETEGYVTTLTNTYTPEKTSVKVTKVWADDENESKKRPENVTVSLLANGKEYDTIILSEENEWKHEFTELPVYNAGEKITWDVREENVPEGYVASYEYDDEKGIIIHNVLGQGGEEPPPDNPQTGDNIMLYLLMMIISIIGFVSGKKYLRENN